MPNDIFQFINMVKNNNPEQMVMSMLQQSTSTNPIARNILSLAQQGDYQQIEQIVRNMAREKGIDFDKEFNNFKQTFGF